MLMLAILCTPPPPHLAALRYWRILDLGSYGIFILVVMRRAITELFQQADRLLLKRGDPLHHIRAFIEQGPEHGPDFLYVENHSLS